MTEWWNQTLANIISSLGIIIILSWWVNRLKAHTENIPVLLVTVWGKEWESSDLFCLFSMEAWSWNLFYCTDLLASSSSKRDWYSKPQTLYLTSSCAFCGLTGYTRLPLVTAVLILDVIIFRLFGHKFIDKRSQVCQILWCLQHTNHHICGCAWVLTGNTSRVRGYHQTRR